MYIINFQDKLVKNVSESDNLSLIKILYYFIICEKALSDNQNVSYTKLYNVIKLYQKIISKYEILDEKTAFNFFSKNASKSYIKSYLSAQIENMYEYVHLKN